MSYCRFNNTLNDLKDCEEALYENESLSKEERAKAVRLILTCQDIAKQFEGQNEEEILDSFKKEEDDEEEEEREKMERNEI